MKDGIISVHNGYLAIESASLAELWGIGHNEIVQSIEDLRRPEEVKRLYFERADDEGYWIRLEGILAIAPHFWGNPDNLHLRDIFEAFAATPLTFGTRLISQQVLEREVVVFEAAIKAKTDEADEAHEAKIAELKAELAAREAKVATLHAETAAIEAETAALEAKAAAVKAETIALLKEHSLVFFEEELDPERIGKTAKELREGCFRDAIVLIVRRDGSEESVFYPLPRLECDLPLPGNPN
jgi:hypothetical protein